MSVKENTHEKLTQIEKNIEEFQKRIRFQKDFRVFILYSFLLLETTMKKQLESNYGLEKFLKAQDFLPLLETDYVEFYVGNANKTFIKTAFGFQSYASKGLRDWE